MRERLLAAALALPMILTARVARADQCYYDKDCPAGYVCRYGACVVPGYQSSTPSSQPAAGPPSGKAFAFGAGLAIALIVVGLMLLNSQQTDVPQPLLSPLP